MAALATPAAPASVLSIGAIAERLGVAPWQVRRLFTRGLLPEPARVGVSRVVPVAELPVICAALVAAGYLTPDAVEQPE